MIEITVYGTPAPQGSKRHVGRGILVESSAKVKPWRQDVKHAALEAIAQGGDVVAMLPLQGPVKLSVVFTLAKPKSAPKRSRTWPCRKPDIDKLVRSTLDALTEAGVWVDDGQVVEEHSRKVYPGEGALSLHTPGARIWIERITE